MWNCILLLPKTITSTSRHWLTRIWIITCQTVRSPIFICISNRGLSLVVDGWITRTSPTYLHLDKPSFVISRAAHIPPKPLSPSHLRYVLLLFCPTAFSLILSASAHERFKSKCFKFKSSSSVFKNHANCHPMGFFRLTFLSRVDHFFSMKIVKINTSIGRLGTSNFFRFVFSYPCPI